MPREAFLWPPDPLPVHRNMQPAIAFGLGIGAARFHGIDDDPVVADLVGQHMGRLFHCRLDRVRIAQREVEGQVVRRFGVQVRPTGHQAQMHI